MAARFEAYGWHTQKVDDGNDLAAIDRALRAARAETERPSLILVRTHSGLRLAAQARHVRGPRFAAGRRGGAADQGEPGLADGAAFYIPDDAAGRTSAKHSRAAARRRTAGTPRWPSMPSNISSWPRSCNGAIDGQLPDGWDADLPHFEPGVKAGGHARSPAARP